MASTPEGDIPGLRGAEGSIVSFGAVASGGANAILGFFGPYPWPIRVRNAWYIPTSGNQSATQTGTFRRLSAYNGGPVGTVTATANRVASLNLVATVGSNSPAAFSIVDPTGTTETIAAGNMLYFSQETVGGTDANGTVLAGGQFALAYEIV
jgi:hypothetical protein